MEGAAASAASASCPRRSSATPENASAQSEYQIQVQRTAGTCCINDLSEPDDTQYDAPEVSVGQTFSGTLCPNDTDMRGFEVSQPQSMALHVKLTSSGSLPSVTLSILNAVGGLVTSASNVIDDVALEFFPASPGMYFAKVSSNGGAPVEFEGSIDVAESSICFQSTDCPIGTVCDVLSGGCDSSLCYDPALCPPGTVCDQGTTFESMGTCVAPCTSDLNCRAEFGEQCKKMLAGSHCGLAGSGSLGWTEDLWQQQANWHGWNAFLQQQQIGWQQWSEGQEEWRRRQEVLKKQQDEWRKGQEVVQQRRQ